MTFHRRRRSETMQHSSKDKANSSCIKDKLDSQEGQKSNLPLFKKSVYIDVKSGKQAEVIESQLKKLGATVEKFLSREVNYVISSSALPTKFEERSSNEDNPASPSCSIPSPFSSVPSPTPPSETKAAVVSRGKALAQIACSRSRASTVVTNAEKWGIKVVAVETASKWLEREMQKIVKDGEKTNAKKEVTKKEVQKPKKKVIRRKKKTLKGCYIKFESTTGMYRPIKSELDKWPRVNLLAPPGLFPYCDVKMKLHNFLRRHSSMRNVRGSLLASSGRSSLKKTRSMSSIKESASLVTATPQATADVVAVPITTTGDVKRHLGLIHRRRPDKLQGYCECCRVKYKDMNQHIKEDDHQSFARDKSNFESLDDLIKQVPSTSQFLQDILLRHCVQKQIGSVSQNISNESKEVAPKLDIDVLPVISPIPSEATPHAAEGIILSTKLCPKSPSISREACDQGADKFEDPRPHAVVIRRRNSSGVFVSPRRREPTPSKRPWMQERFMVFRDSPMASLQPSGLNCSMNDTSLPNLPQDLNERLTRSCDQSKTKSIVRSLIEMPDFITSPTSSSDADSVKNSEEEISVPQKCMEVINEADLGSKQDNMNNDIDSSDSEQGAESPSKFQGKGPVISVNWEEDKDDEIQNEPQISKISPVVPVVFVPCIADRVKRRSRAIEEGKSKDSESNSYSPLVNTSENKLNQNSRGDDDVPLDNGLVLYQEMLNPCQEKINSNDYDSNVEKLKSDLLQEEGVEEPNSISEDTDIKTRFRSSRNGTPNVNDADQHTRPDCNEEDQISQLIIDPEESSNRVSCVKEDSNFSTPRGRKNRKRSKSHEFSYVSKRLEKDEEILDSKLSVEKESLNKKYLQVTPQKKAPNSTGKLNKKRNGSGKRDKRKKSGLGDAAQVNSTMNVAGSVKSRVRQCRLFVHEGFYADDKVDVEFDTISNFEPEKKTRSGLNMKRETPELIELDEANSNNMNKPVVEINAKGDSKFEMKLNRVMETGKRIFRGKKFHSTQADWDTKKEDEEGMSDDWEDDEEPVRLTVGERVKNRRSCTLFNHKGQYSNNGEGGHNDEADCNKESDSANHDYKEEPDITTRECWKELDSTSQSPHHFQHNKSISPAVVLRRLPSSRSGLTKADKTWCKLMSKTDWTQFEDNAQPPPSEELPENDFSGEDNNLGFLGKLKPAQAHGQKREVITSPSPHKETRTHSSHPVQHFSTPLRRHARMSEFNGFTSPDNNANLESGCRDVESSTKSKRKSKILPKSLQFHGINDAVQDKVSTRSPRLKLRIVRDVGSDCYSSTLEELHNENNVDFTRKEIDNESNLLGTHCQFSNESSSSNDPSFPNGSDSIDLLDTPRRGRKYSDCSVKNLPDRKSHLSSSPHCKKDVVLMKSPSSRKVKKKRKFSEAERETQKEQDSMDRPYSVENDRLHEKVLKDVHIDDKPVKRRKRNNSIANDGDSEMYARCESSKSVEINSSAKRNSMKNNSTIISSCKESSILSKNIFHSVSKKVHSLQQMDSQQEVICDTSMTVSADNELKLSSCKMGSKSNSKSKEKRKRKRRSSGDADTATHLESKKVKLDQRRSDVLEEKGSFSNSLLCSPSKNRTNHMLTKTSTFNKEKHIPGDKLFHEPAFPNDLLDFVPTFSSPGKTNSSWDDACDSYLSTSFKSNEIQGNHSTFNHGASSLMWSPVKFNSPAKSRSCDKKYLQSKKSESDSKSGDISKNSFQVNFPNRNSHGYCVTPTKRKNSSLCNAGSPSVQKVDSVISFNHMSPQRLNFSPVKLKSPLKTSEKSPGVRRLESDISFNHISPSKKSNVRKHL